MMAAEALGFSIWTSAVERADSAVPAAWRPQIQSVTVPGYAGFEVSVDPTNRVLQAVLLGRAQSTGTYVVEAKTPILTGDRWNLGLPDTKLLVSKWNAGVGTCAVFDMEVGCKPTVDQKNRTVDLMIATTRKVEREPDASLSFAPVRSDLTFGAARVSVPAGHSFGQVDRRSWLEMFTFKSVSETEFQIQEEKELSRDEFTSAITKADPEDALVYVHGFRNTFDDSVFRLQPTVRSYFTSIRYCLFAETFEKEFQNGRELQNARG